MEADEQFFIKLQKGYRMDRPKYSTQKVYDIMRECWLHDPIARPDFMRLSELLGDQLDASVRRHYIDLNDAYVQANVASTTATDSPDYLSMMSPVDYVNVGSRSSPMPPQRQQQQQSAYVNIPTTSDDDDLMRCDNNRQSQQDYLTMGTAPPANDGAYLMMLASPKATDSGPSQFDFSSAHHMDLNKTQSQDKMTIGDSVELRPMVSPNGFSNPNYLNPPSVKCTLTDLDDPPKYSDAIEKSPPQQPPQHYVNISAASAPPRHVKSVDDEQQDELHYVKPKNNSRVSP